MKCDGRRGPAYDARMRGIGPIFPGDTVEAFSITLAVTRQCKSLDGAGEGGQHCDTEHRCAAHGMLLNQQVVNHLVFMHRMAAELLAEEYLLPRLPHHGLGVVA